MSDAPGPDNDVISVPSDDGPGAPALTPEQQSLFAWAPTPLTNDEWYTPAWIFGTQRFDLDVCSPADAGLRTTPADRYLTADDDGLTTTWEGRVWMNPPYSQAFPWVERWAAYEGAGGALLPCLPTVHWRSILLDAAEFWTFLHCSFHRPNGKLQGLMWPLLLVAKGDGALDLVRDATNRDRYGHGIYFTSHGERRVA